ncbi:unnamed protein product [Coregonus sp. 'balchen']|nr:unnamed protein product [Coregonus sp. 'balchen']
MVWTNTGPRALQLPWHFGYAAKWLRGHPEVEVAQVRGLDNRLKDLNWLSLHKGLPVRSLYGCGMTQSPTCPRPTCGGEETLRHVSSLDSEEGIVRRVEQNLRGRMKREERKWGQHAARERWKGGLGLGLV